MFHAYRPSLSLIPNHHLSDAEADADAMPMMLKAAAAAVESSAKRVSSRLGMGNAHKHTATCSGAQS